MENAAAQDRAAAFFVLYLQLLAPYRIQHKISSVGLGFETAALNGWPAEVRDVPQVDAPVCGQDRRSDSS